MITAEFTKWLEQFINFERSPKKDILNLKTMRKYCDYFNHPEMNYNTIHIAGSKGKGSVATMVSSILTEAGFKTGIYTSPHISDFRERVSMYGKFFSNTAYSTAYTKIKTGFNEILKANKDIDPTWFEIVTMLAFYIFHQEKMEWGVFEVGMGGRLDTTNIITPKASVIMSIELEHCKYLGDTLEKIAFEKAGIIKEGIPVFCFQQNKKAFTVIERQAKEKNADLFYLPEIIEYVTSTVSINGLNIEIHFNKNNHVGKLFRRSIKTTLSLLDEVQSMNAAIASCIIKYLSPNVDETVIELGLQKAWLPGRFEILQKDTLIIVDGAHTKNSINLCLSTYTKITKTNNGILIFACAEDKDTEAIAPLFKNKFSKVYLTIPGSFKKSNLEKTKQDFCIISNNLTVSEDFEGIIKNAFTESKEKHIPVLVTGSFYLAAEAKKIWNKLN